jgi:hypothetical protein
MTPWHPKLDTLACKHHVVICLQHIYNTKKKKTHNHNIEYLVYNYVATTLHHLHSTMHMQYNIESLQ